MMALLVIRLYAINSLQNKVNFDGRGLENQPPFLSKRIIYERLRLKTPSLPETPGRCAAGMKADLPKAGRAI